MYIPHKKAGGRQKLTISQFLQNARAKHGDRYDYTRVIYRGTHTPVEIICKQHGVFSQRPYAHISNKQGCPTCGDIVKQQKDMCRTTSLSQFISKANAVHKNKYCYDKVQYKNTHTKIEITCRTHGSFFQKPCDHLNKPLGCPRCASLRKRGVRFSQKAIEWIESIASVEDITIQHAGNGGEYKVPHTTYIVDGFCQSTNTIYEFYGNKWHGNPSLYEPASNPHPLNKSITAKQLFKKTIDRENKLRQMGYNVITMWESDWDKYVTQQKKEMCYVNV